MSETAIYRDNFSKSFTEEEALLDFLHEREQNATWTTIPTRDVRIQSPDKHSITGHMRVQSHNMLASEVLILSSTINICVVLIVSFISSPFPCL